MGHASFDPDAEMRHVGELDRVVVAGEDGVGEILADLVLVDVERGRKFDIANVVTAQVHVHQTRDRCSGFGVAIELDALHQRRRAVAHSQDRNSYLPP